MTGPSSPGGCPRDKSRLTELSKERQGLAEEGGDFSAHNASIRTISQFCHFLVAMSPRLSESLKPDRDYSLCLVKVIGPPSGLPQTPQPRFPRAAVRRARPNRECRYPRTAFRKEGAAARPHPPGSRRRLTLFACNIIARRAQSPTAPDPCAQSLRLIFAPNPCQAASQKGGLPLISRAACP